MVNCIITYRNTLLFTYVNEVLHEYQNTNVRIVRGSTKNSLIKKKTFKGLEPT